MDCICDAALEAATKEKVWTRRFSAATAAKIMAGSDTLSSSREQVHYRCRACKKDWFYLEWDQGGIQFNYLSTVPDQPIRPEPPPCGCAAMLASNRSSEPLPLGRDEQKIIDGCEVVSTDVDAIYLRCRSCQKAWTKQRYDRGHVFFEYLTPG